MSALHEAVTEYVATRRALGAKFYGQALALHHFADFLRSEGAEFVTSALAVRWATEPTGVQPATWARRLGIVRCFAIWLHATDPRTEVPPRGLLPARQRRRPPHIFSDDEIEDLMAEAARLPSPTGMRSHTCVTHIGILAATGLRPGEAVALDVQDVDLENGILAVRKTKFGKSRFVPVEETTRAALEHYAARRDEVFPRRRTEAFLVSKLGTRVRPSSARLAFAKLCQAVGLRAPLDGGRIGHGPRLQDFRHTFATRRLVEWYRAELDVNQMMPALSTYLGHVRVQDTYWYVEAVPELLQLATERAAARSPGGAR